MLNHTASIGKNANFWDCRQALKLVFSDEEDPNKCFCRDVLDHDKPYFPHKLPASCFLEKRPYKNKCEVKGCLYLATVHKIVNLRYVLTDASISEHIEKNHPKIDEVIRKQVRVYLCVKHFEDNLIYCCKICHQAKEQERVNKEWEEIKKKRETREKQKIEKLYQKWEEEWVSKNPKTNPV